jgi:uncharacterized protein YyaL (SSP411 family)
MHTNQLIQESSPYLLQHAHNPVNWVPWSKDALDLAKQENKLVLISIGYSACHWCHVMEHECFENEEVAALMNEHFINIKVDREEHPDVDQVYMTAVQLMTQKGGWPLNCFTLPDGSPVYGGTYFPKEQWMHVLKSLVHTIHNDKEKVLEYATKLKEGVQQSELIDQPAQIQSWDPEKLHELVLRWSHSFDSSHGGPTRAPKFPLPSNLEFLLTYGVWQEHEKSLGYVQLTLDKMAMGGIYDQLGGGFSRYSVDMLWKVPHFEKMLYDNGQLLEVYAKAYKYFGKELYKETCYGILNWLQREMLSDSGAFYSALDADSEGEEGKFYCWDEEELKTLLGQDFDWVKDYFNINQLGFWEEEKYILLRNETDESFAKRNGWEVSFFKQKLESVKDSLLHIRNQRIKPGMDDKCLTSWNAMVISGLCEAYGAFDDELFVIAARKTATWIENNQIKSDGTLWRTHKNGISKIDGVLEDYAFVIKGFIDLYQVTFEEKWIEIAKNLSETVETNFQDTPTKMCYYTSVTTELIARKMELNDNVIPASNSVMAHNFHRLSYFYRNEEWRGYAEQMLANVYEGMEMYGSGYSNWALLLLQLIDSMEEIEIVGPNAHKIRQKMNKKFKTGTIYSGGTHFSLPILKEKQVLTNKTILYRCKGEMCDAPLECE